MLVWWCWEKVIWISNICREIDLLFYLQQVCWWKSIFKPLHYSVACWDPLLSCFLGAGMCGGARAPCRHSSTFLQTWVIGECWAVLDIQALKCLCGAPAGASEPWVTWFCWRTAGKCEHQACWDKPGQFEFERCQTPGQHRSSFPYFRVFSFQTAFALGLHNSDL